MVAQYAGTSNKIGNGFGVFFIYLFVTFYGGCMDVSTYVYCSEIFPTGIRAQGVGFSVSGLFLTALIYTQAAPTAFKNIGWKYYLVFIFIPLFCVIILLKYLPETKGLTLEEVCRHFRSFLLFYSLPSLSSHPFWRMQADHGPSQISGMFGDEVALDINHMSEEDRAVLDKKLAAVVDIDDMEKQDISSSYYEKVLKSETGETLA